jgi:D-glycero-D-manno-heptose 1,7-bisphosphate phosphatase
MNQERSIHVSSKLIILDRDGVINVDRGYVHKWEDWEWCDGAAEACLALLQAGWQLEIVTNQSGIGRGLFTVDDFTTLMQQVRRDFYNRLVRRLPESEQVSCRFLATNYFCQHIPDDRCKCRKPKTAFWRGIKSVYRSISESWFVDDKLENLDFGRQAGSQLVWIGTEATLEPTDYVCFPSLHKFAEHLLGKEIPWRVKS